MSDTDAVREKLKFAVKLFPAKAGVAIAMSVAVVNAAKDFDMMDMMNSDEVVWNSPFAVSSP